MMDIMSKGFRKIGYLINTILSKMIYKGLSVNGIFRKRHDTQIIISDNGKMNLGRNVLFQRNVSISSIGGELIIGDNVSFNRNCILISRNKIVIGDNVIFGPGVTVYDHDHVFSEKGILPGYNHGAVIIDKDCWIAANVTILRNTHIGQGSVVGAGAVVKGEIPPHSLVTNDRTLKIVPIETRT